MTKKMKFRIIKCPETNEFLPQVYYELKLPIGTVDYELTYKVENGWASIGEWTEYKTDAMEQIYEYKAIKFKEQARNGAERTNNPVVVEEIE